MQIFCDRRRLGKCALILVLTVVVSTFGLQLLDSNLFENRCVVGDKNFSEGEEHPTDDCICDNFGDYSDWVCDGY